jgi:competence protein ComEC
VTFEFLSPDENTPSGSNNRSCVLMIDNGQIRSLITGDIEQAVERYLVRNSDVQLGADILLVPHQGSKTSSTERFIDAVSPSLALVAAGYLNHYGHPHEQVIQRYAERGIPVLSTQNHGSIRLSVERTEIHTESFRSAEARFWRR